MTFADLIARHDEAVAAWENATDQRRYGDEREQAMLDAQEALLHYIGCVTDTEAILHGDRVFLRSDNNDLCVLKVTPSSTEIPHAQ